MKYIGEEIYKAIPNRKPLMLLETLTVEPESAVATMDLKGDEWFFTCHFPGNPIMPFSLLIESLSQVWVSIVQQYANEGEIPMFSAFGVGGKISLREKVVPGDKLRLEAKMESFRHGLAKGVCNAYKNDQENPIVSFEIMHVVPSKMIRR